MSTLKYYRPKTKVYKILLSFGSFSINSVHNVLQLLNLISDHIHLSNKRDENIYIYHCKRNQKILVVIHVCVNVILFYFYVRVHWYPCLLQGLDELTLTYPGSFPILGLRLQSNRPRFKVEKNRYTETRILNRKNSDKEDVILPLIISRINS